MTNVSVSLRVSARHNKDTEWKESERETGFDAEGRYCAHARERNRIIPRRGIPRQISQAELNIALDTSYSREFVDRGDNVLGHVAISSA